MCLHLWNSCYLKSVFHYFTYLPCIYGHSFLLLFSTSLILLFFQFLCKDALNICTVLGNGWRIAYVEVSEDAVNIYTIINQANTTIFLERSKTSGFCRFMEYDSSRIQQISYCRATIGGILCQRINSGISYLQ